MVELGPLLARLDAIEHACREERWDAAATLLAEHDAHIRAIAVEGWTADMLTTLIHRSSALEAILRAGREQAAIELKQLGNQRRSVKAYRS